VHPAQAEGSALHESATSTHRSTGRDLDLIGTSIGSTPRLLLATGTDHRGLHEPGTSRFDCPGRLDLGIYSAVDIHSGTVEVGQPAFVTAGRTP
jgi:hypothetical protein